VQSMYVGPVPFSVISVKTAGQTSAVMSPTQRLAWVTKRAYRAAVRVLNHSDPGALRSG